MFLARLDLLAFGPFRDLSLDLAERGLHVVYGGNEAGKSTTLRAITGLLYGIDRRTKDAHLHKMGDLRIGGVVCGTSGERLRIVRRKGDANTLLDEHGKPIDDSVLLRLLGGVTKETFESAFGLDHVKLRDGAKALLEGKGALGESLFDASVGGGGEVQRLVRELEAEADAIYRPRGQSLPLNEALKAYAEAEKAVKQKQSLPEAYVKQERALEEAKAERTQRADRRATLAKKRNVLERDRKRVPLERRRVLRATELAAFGALAGAAPRVEALVAGLATFERAMRDKVGAELDALRAKDRVGEAAARCGVSPSGSASRLDVRAESRVLRLLAERAAIEQKTLSSRTEIGRAERELASADGVVAEVGSARVLAEEALVRALTPARALGDAEARHASTAQRLARRRSELAKRAGALGLAPSGAQHDLDAIAALVLPAEVTIDRLVARAEDEAGALARHEERLEGLDDEVLAIERQLAEHTGDFAPPDARALLDARAARDAAWTAFRVSKRDADADAFERARTSSDAIADQMIREADRVTTLARLRSTAETLAKQRKRAAAERDKARAAQAATLAEVSALVRDLGVPRDLHVTELGALAERHRRVVEDHERLVAEEAEAELSASEIANAKAALAEALRAVDEPAPADSLAALVATAARIVDGASARRSRGEERDKARAKLAAEVAERRLGLTVDEATLAETRASLAELLAPLGLPPDASADEVQRTLEALRDLETAEAQLSDAERRRESATREVASFAETVARAATELAPDLAAASTAEAVATLASRARAAEELRREVLALDAQIAELGERGELAAEELAVLADPDASLAALEVLDGELEEIDRDLSRLDQQIGGIKMSLEAWGLDSGAAEASATAQAELARIRLHTERWCRAKVAAEILRREIERYREENQGPLLGSTSALFARLTRGGFKGVRAGFDEKDQASIRCVRADGNEVEVEGLSEGTRDQLYLALRLASLRRHAEIAGPMPVVLDDVLVHFDDERSRAALVALAELAETMQIVFFTHHERNVELAREAVPSALLHVHVLSSPAVAPQPAQLSSP